MHTQPLLLGLCLNVTFLESLSLITLSKIGSFVTLALFPIIALTAISLIHLSILQMAYELYEGRHFSVSLSAEVVLEIW